jgi:hypothetical protein
MVFQKIALSSISFFQDSFLKIAFCLFYNNEQLFISKNFVSMGNKTAQIEFISLSRYIFFTRNKCLWFLCTRTQSQALVSGKNNIPMYYKCLCIRNMIKLRAVKLRSRWCSRNSVYKDINSICAVFKHHNLTSTPPFVI